MQISTDFAPPFNLVAPYIIAGLVSLFLSNFLLFGMDLDAFSHLKPLVLSWIHLFLLGFVMSVILGALAQLIPVVLEVGHYKVWLYYVVFPLFVVGVWLMVYGFYFDPILLSFGGGLVFLSFLIFLFENFMTILKVKQVNFTIFTVIMSNILLLVGLLFGIFLALNYAGYVSIDILSFLKAHVYLVFVGFVGFIVMGISLVLIPMFWLSHDFSWRFVKASCGFLLLSFICLTGEFFSSNLLIKNMGNIFLVISLFLYFLQIYEIYKKRIRKQKDVYYVSMVFAYICFFVSIFLAIFVFVSENERFLSAMWWLIIYGFVTILIIGHLYKIVPFLVWYERFSPLVGKQKVPMLSEMICEKSAKLQLYLQCVGVIICFIALLFGLNIVLKVGATFLICGGAILLKDIIKIVLIKGEQYV